MQRREFLRLAGGAGGACALGPGVAGSAAASHGSDEEGEGYEPLGRLELDRAYDAVASEDGRIAYVATGDGYATVDLADPADPRLLAARSDLLADHEDGPLEQIWDVAAEDDDLLVVGPAHTHGSVDAAVHVDVSDPSDPEPVGVHYTDYPIHNGDLADGHAYLTANGDPGNPLAIVDLAGADEPREVARWSVVDRDPAWEEVHSSLRVVHDVHVADDVAYLAYWDAGTHLLDVSDPAEPAYIGGVDPYEPADLADLTGGDVLVRSQVPPGNHHMAAPNEDGVLLAVNVESWAVDADEDGERIGGPGGVHLYDVADAADPEHLATIDPPESPDPTQDGVWTTSHNFELRGDRLYTSWYEGGVKIHDVSDPADPEELAWWRDPVDASFWTAQVAVPGEFFLASSTHHRPTEAALYTFPDRAGEQVDPPSMADALDEEATENSTETPAETPTETPGGTPSSADGDSHTSESGSTSSGDNSSSGETDSVAETNEETPGFGAGSGVAALGGATWWALRRAGDDP